MALDSDIFDIEKQQEESRKKAIDLARVEKEDFEWLMNNKRGRRIVWRLLSNAGVFKTSFNSNALTMAFSEGARNQGLSLLMDVMNNCPDSYLLMIEESRS